MIERQMSEGPSQVTAENVIFWSRHAREMQGTMKSKALQFLNHDCVHYIGFDSTFDSRHTFIVLPLSKSEDFTYQGVIFKKKPFLRDYNSSEYLVYKRESDKRFVCNCQGWQSAERDLNKRRFDGCQCSHVLALFLCFKIRKFGKAEGADQEHVDPDLYE